MLYHPLETPAGPQGAKDLPGCLLTQAGEPQSFVLTDGDIWLVDEQLWMNDFSPFPAIPH